MLVVLAALLVPAAPASAHRLSLAHAQDLAERLDDSYRARARSPVVDSFIFRARRVSSHRIDFRYEVSHRNGRNCTATIKTQFRSSRTFAGRAVFIRVRCEGPPA